MVARRVSLIAVGQFAPGSDRTENLAEIRGLADDAVGRGATLLVLPEYSSYFTPEMGPDWVAAAEPLDGPFIDGLATVAGELGIHLVAGFIERTEHSNRVSNTVAALDTTGTVVATYRKLHLYDAFGHRESQWVVPGEMTAPETFEWAEFTVGLQTCYDLRFPEVTRRLVDVGADLVLVPSEWVRGPLKEHHWRTLVTARALENTIYVAAADHAPPIGVGNSMVVDPMGVELATIGDEPGVAVAAISAERLTGVREINPALGLRRFRVVEA